MAGAKILSAILLDTVGGYYWGGEILPLQTLVGVLSLILVEAVLHHSLFPFFLYCVVG